MTLLKSNFYTVIELEQKGDQLQAIVTIDPNHKIFEGHFPGQPVVPGVCMLQMIKELAERQLDKSLLLREASQIKYLNVLIPITGDKILIQIDWRDAVKFDAAIICNEKAIMKMSGSF